MDQTSVYLSEPTDHNWWHIWIYNIYSISYMVHFVAYINMYYLMSYRSRHKFEQLWWHEPTIHLGSWHHLTGITMRKWGVRWFSAQTLRDVLCKFQFRRSWQPGGALCSPKSFQEFGFKKSTSTIWFKKKLPWKPPHFFGKLAEMLGERPSSANQAAETWTKHGVSVIGKWDRRNLGKLKHGIPVLD